MTPAPNRRWLGVLCFAVAACGIVPASYVAFHLGMNPLQGLAYVALFPTTAIGLGGGFGSRHGQTLRGILIGVAIELIVIIAATTAAIAGLI